MRRLLPLAPAFSLALLSGGCSDDGGSATGETLAGTDGPATDSASGSPTTDPSTTGISDTDSSSGDEDSSPDSSGDGGCTPDDECVTDSDCAPGQVCSAACSCIGEATGCLEWGTGNYEPCVFEGTVDNSMCSGSPLFCLVDNVTTPTAGVCTNTECNEKCDCGQPPEGFDEQVTCEDLTADGDGDCFISCNGGKECPENMFCLANLFCTHGEPPPELDPYGNCFTQNGICPNDGACLSDNVSFGVCTHGCESDADCREAPETGNAPVACIDIADLPGKECYLDCFNGEECPEGMLCHEQAAVCVWGPPPPDPEPYGDCVNNPPEDCLETEACVVGQVDGTDAAVCSTTGCNDVADCPAAPAGGDAVLTCGDLGDGNVCYLDCSDDAECPTGMECADNDVCMWPSNNDGTPRPGLTCNPDAEPLRVRRVPFAPRSARLTD